MLRFLGIIFSLLIISCNNTSGENKKVHTGTVLVEDYVAVMQKHLNAVTNRDIETLGSTLAPTGEMQLILPGSEIMESVDKFMNYHREWFKDSTWTFETKILNSKVDENLAIAITEVVYREPIRDGKPYFNRMIVSYVLEKINGQWYVIKDHASSVEKSTDAE